jgi:putative transposase
MRFFEKATQANGVPEKVGMDKSGANKAAIDVLIEQSDVEMVVMQVKYLNNVVEQDHRAVKRVSRPMLDFKSFRAATDVLAGIGLMHMIRKSQLAFAEQFYALAGQVRPT